MYIFWIGDGVSPNFRFSFGVAKLTTRRIPLRLDAKTPVRPGLRARDAGVGAEVSEAACVPRINANDRKLDPTKLTPKPVRHRAGLKTNALCQWAMFTQQVG